MIDYLIRKSNRAKRARITIRQNGEVIVTVPQKMKEDTAAEFIKTHENWINTNLEKIKERKPKIELPKVPGSKLKEYKKELLILIEDRLTYYNKQYGFKWNNITIRNQKSRWGSCSKQGNLNFNYKIGLLDPLLRDYVIVHELCHLHELNHSKSFWTLVERTFPKYLIARKSLRNIA
ncbi:MAG: putative metal-dependent hydrolase [Candidatus Nomurabacteria bacterium]|nr:putative metal-dependent hydrolase [Candidatus Nomurabacteria bacterium]